VASYEHAYELVRVHGEARWDARLVPLTVDGLIYASSMVLLDSARRKVPVPAPARWLLGLGIGRRRRPAVVLVGSYELLMMIIRGAQVPADVTAVAGLPGRPPDADPLQMQVAQVFADDLAAGRVASVRAIETRAQLCSGLLSLQRARRSNRRSPGVPPHGRAQRPGRRLNRGSFPATGRGSPTPLVNAALHT